MASLQEQLLKAGMVDAKKAKRLEKEKRKAAKQQPKGKPSVNEAREQALQAQAEKTERDREANRKQREIAEAKAITAQIKQLIDVNRVARDGGEVAYQFTDGSKIKKLYVTSAQQSQLVRGQLAIVKFDEAYSLVPAPVAQKISQRDEAYVQVLNQEASRDALSPEDDPYADYQIPDDLMW
ncbi:MAG: DUF2058 domain-containing protein [Halioglobus sp.]